MTDALLNPICCRQYHRCRP